MLSYFARASAIASIGLSVGAFSAQVNAADAIKPYIGLQANHIFIDATQRNATPQLIFHFIIKRITDWLLVLNSP